MWCQSNLCVQQVEMIQVVFVLLMLVLQMVVRSSTHHQMYFVQLVQKALT